MIVLAHGTTSYHHIDPHVLENFEPNTIKVRAAISEFAIPIGAAVKANTVKIELPEGYTDIEVVVTLVGTRKGFAGLRLPTRTKAEFDANERFIKSAYPGAEKR